MLVIFRKPHEKILIPAIGACIHVAAVQPGVVRVAINAPPEVAILRGELADRAAAWGAPGQPAPAPAAPAKCRRLRKRLRLASMSLGLARLQLQTGFNREAAAVLGKVQRQIEALRRYLDRKKEKVRPAGARQHQVPQPSGLLFRGRCGVSPRGAEIGAPAW